MDEAIGVAHGQCNRVGEQMRLDHRIMSDGTQYIVSPQAPGKQVKVEPVGEAPEPIIRAMKLFRQLYDKEATKP